MQRHPLQQYQPSKNPCPMNWATQEVICIRVRGNSDSKEYSRELPNQCRTNPCLHSASIIPIHNSTSLLSQCSRSTKQMWETKYAIKQKLWCSNIYTKKKYWERHIWYYIPQQVALISMRNPTRSRQQQVLQYGAKQNQVGGMLAMLRSHKEKPTPWLKQRTQWGAPLHNGSGYSYWTWVMILPETVKLLS